MTTKAKITSNPFLKWPGGKRKVVPYLVPHLGLPAKRLVEPFCGSCALSLSTADKVTELWLNDINPDLMNLLAQLKYSPAQLLKATREYFSPFMNNEAAYYRLRNHFNETNDALDRAALFIYFNRHGYNGLCRYNMEGKFNVPFGRYKKPYFPEKEMIAAHQVLSKSKLTQLDFEEVLEQCEAGDVVYCDPPYIPISATSSFTSYSAGGFGLTEQRRLAQAARNAARRGALVILSNHDVPLSRELYRDAIKYSINVRRNISCDGTNRAIVKEIIAVYLPQQSKNEVAQ